MNDIPSNPNIHEVFSTNIICSNDGEIEHPKIYLKIDKKIGQISCPYCRKIFKLAKPQNIQE